MKKKLYLSVLGLLLALSMFSLVEAQIEVAGGEQTGVILGIEELPVFNNNTAFVNSSDYWITLEGALKNVVDLFPTLDGRYSLISDVLWELAGDFVQLKTAKSIDFQSMNLTNIGQLQAPDGSALKIGDGGIFTGIDQAINLQTNQTTGSGVITHVLTDLQGQKIIEAWQNGKPNAAGYERNSKITSGDYGITNASILTDCPTMISLSGATPFIGCNTTDLGAARFTQGSQQIGHQLYFGGGNLTTSGFLGNNLSFATFLLQEGDLDIYGGNGVHIQSQRIDSVGFEVGDIVSLMTETFNDGTLGVFTKISQIGIDIRNWRAVSESQCHIGFCGTARGGDSSAERIMQTNITTIDLDNLNVSFWITRVNNDVGETLDVEFNNNIGSGWVSGFSTATNPTDEFQTFIAPSSMDDQTLVTINVKHHASSHLERSWIDVFTVTGNVTSSSAINVTVSDAKIELGDGSCNILVNGTSNDMEIGGVGCNNITFIGNTSFTSITVTDQNVTGNIIASGNITAGENFFGADLNILNSGWFGNDLTVNDRITGNTLNLNGNSKQILLDADGVAQTLGKGIIGLPTTTTLPSEKGALASVGGTNTWTKTNTYSATATPSASMAQRVEHLGDADTYIDYFTNQIKFSIGGLEIIDLLGTLVTINGDLNVTNNGSVGENLTVGENLEVGGSITSLNDCGIPSATGTFAVRTVISNAAWGIGAWATYGMPQGCSGIVTTMSAHCSGTNGTSLDAVLRKNNVATSCVLGVPQPQGIANSTTCDESFNKNDVIGIYSGTEVGAWTSCTGTIWMRYD